MTLPLAHTERLKARVAELGREAERGSGYWTAIQDVLALLTEADASPETPQSPDDVMDIYVPGAWKCLKCGFALSQATIFMGNGGQIGCTRDQVMKMTGERCPNDGAEMVRVTWHDRAIENQQWGESLMNDIIAATDTPSLPDAVHAIRTAFARRCEFCNEEIIKDAEGDWMDRDTGLSCDTGPNKRKPHRPTASPTLPEGQAVGAAKEGGWKRAALLKERTRREMRERFEAGNTAAEIAVDWDVPVEFVASLVAWQMFSEQGKPFVGNVRCANCGERFDQHYGEDCPGKLGRFDPTPAKGEAAGAAKEIGKSLNLMAVRKWVDEGFDIQKRLGYFKATLASTIASQIWLHIRDVLDGQRPSPCHCGCSRAAHIYYESGGIFTACQVCACEAYAPSEAAGAPTQEKE